MVNAILWVMKFIEGLYFHHADGSSNHDILHNEQHKYVDDAVQGLQEAIASKEEQAVRTARRNVAEILSNLMITTRLLAADTASHRSAIVQTVNPLLPDSLKFSD